MIGKGKRGLDEPRSFMVGLIILAVFAAIVIAGIYFIYQYFNQGGGQLPEELELAVQACEVAVQGGLQVSYCVQFRDIGRNDYASCDYINDNVAGVEFEQDLDCSGFDAGSSAREFCVNEELNENEEVNGRTCGDLAFCEKGYGGKWISGSCNGEVVTALDSPPEGKNICCVASA